MAGRPSPSQRVRPRSVPGPANSECPSRGSRNTSAGIPAGERVVRVGRFSLATPSVGRYVQVGIIAGVAFAGAVPDRDDGAFGDRNRLPADGDCDRGGHDLGLGIAPQCEPGDARSTGKPGDGGTEVHPRGEDDRDHAGRDGAGEGEGDDQQFDRSAELWLRRGRWCWPARTSLPFMVDETVDGAAGRFGGGECHRAAPGVAGNVAAGTIVGWEAERLRFLKVTNAAAAAGGLSEPRPAVDPEGCRRPERTGERPRRLGCRAPIARRGAPA